MTLLFQSGLRAFASLTHGRLLKIFFISLVVNALILGALVFAVYWALGTFTLLGWFDWLADWGLTALAALIAYFIYPLLLPLIISFFDDAIAEATEQIDYPDVPRPVPPFWPTLTQDARFTLKAIGLNLLVLPLYLLPGVNVLLYYVLNGYLLGREFFMVVAGRHTTRADAEAQWKRHRLSLIGCGIGVAFCATLPFINLVTPIWAVVLMTHFFHRTQPIYKALTLNNE